MWVYFDLTEKRLVGFKVLYSDYNSGTRNIRSICPLVDTPDCSETEFFTESFDDMVAYIPGDQE